MENSISLFVTLLMLKKVDGASHPERERILTEVQDLLIQNDICTSDEMFKLQTRWEDFKSRVDRLMNTGVPMKKAINTARVAYKDLFYANDLLN